MLDVTAEEVTGAERERLSARIAVLMPQFAEYQENTERRIPVIVLKPGA